MGRKNVLLVRYAEGYREVADTSNVTANGNREGFLALADIDDTSAVDDAGSRWLESLTSPVPAITAGIEALSDAETPYVGWRVRDLLTIPNEAGTPTAYRVTAITVTEDNANGALTFTPELRSNLEVDRDRVERWLKRLSDGTLDGRSAGTTPIDREASPGIVPAGKQPISEQTFSMQLPEAEESPADTVTTQGRLVAVIAKLELNPGTAGTVLRVKKNGTPITFNQNGVLTSDLVMPPGVHWIYCYREGSDVIVGEMDSVTVECVQAGDETERLSVKVLYATEPELGYEPTF